MFSFEEKFSPFKQLQFSHEPLNLMAVAVMCNSSLMWYFYLETNCSQKNFWELAFDLSAFNWIVLNKNLAL